MAQPQGRAPNARLRRRGQQAVGPGRRGGGRMPPQQPPVPPAALPPQPPAVAAAGPQRNNAQVNPPEWDRYLQRLYYDPRQPGSFQSFRKLHQSVRKDGRYQLGTNRLRRWLQNQPAYSRNALYLPKIVKRARVIVTGLYDQYDADIADMQRFANANDGQNYLLVVIDVFSRYMWVEGLRTKSYLNVERALQRIFRRARIPRRLRTDEGLEFTAPGMKPFYSHFNITHFVAMGDHKANYAERAIKTIKSKIFRYMNHMNTNRYKDVVPALVHSYNFTWHKGINMRPADVTFNNEKALWWKQYHPKNRFHEGPQTPPFQFQVGDYVRIPMVSTVFTREYNARWGKEIFVVSDRFRRQGINVYKVEDQDNETVYGTFYEAEMQRVSQDNNNTWEVNQILRVRGVPPNREAYVSFRGWPAFYNRWMPYTRAQNNLARQQAQRQQRHHQQQQPRPRQRQPQVQHPPPRPQTQPTQAQNNIAQQVAQQQPRR